MIEIAIKQLLLCWIGWRRSVNMTIKEAAEKANIDLDELYKRTEEYFKAKMARKEYRKYKYNILAQKRLYEDCLLETLKESLI